MNRATRDTTEGVGAGAPGTVLPWVSSAASRAWCGRASLLIAATMVARWAIAMGTGLSDTEAYYAEWARVPALSYYDHPPLVALLAWLVRHVTSVPQAARLGPVLLSGLFDVLLFRLGARLFSPRAGFFAVVLVHAIPVFFFSGFLLNPEAPLAPLWVAFLLLLSEMQGRDEPWRPLVLGAVVGLAFLAKYTAVLAVPVTLLVLGTSSRGRRWLRRPSLYLAGALALAVASPVLVWNATHGWPSLHLHLSERMIRAPDEGLASALWRVGSAQIAYFHPIVAPGLAGVLGYGLARASGDDRYRFLSMASLPVLAFLLVMMVRAGDSEPHWTMVGYVPLIVAAGGVLDESKGALRRVSRAVFVAALALSGVIGALYLVHMKTPSLARELPGYNPDADPFNETLGWDDLGAAVQAHAAKLGPRTVVAGAHNVLCGHLQSALDDAPAVYCASPRRTQYDFVGRRSPPEDAAVVFVDSDRYPADPSAALGGRACTPAQDVEVARDGLRVGRFHIHDCVPGAGGGR